MRAEIHPGKKRASGGARELGFQQLSGAALEIAAYTERKPRRRKVHSHLEGALLQGHVALCDLAHGEQGLGREGGPWASGDSYCHDAYRFQVQKIFWTCLPVYVLFQAGHSKGVSCHGRSDHLFHGKA